MVVQAINMKIALDMSARIDESGYLTGITAEELEPLLKSRTGKPLTRSNVLKLLKAMVEAKMLVRRRAPSLKIQRPGCPPFVFYNASRPNQIPPESK